MSAAICSCPDRCLACHAKTPGVPTWHGPDGAHYEMVETVPDVRGLHMDEARLARSRWFKYEEAARG